MGFRPDIHARAERAARQQRREERHARKAARREATAQPTAPGGLPADERNYPVSIDIRFDQPANHAPWHLDDFRDAEGNPPPPADNEDLRGYQLRPEAADAFRTWWSAQGYTPEVLDDILAADPVSADHFLDMVNRAIRKQRALRYGANG